MIRRKVWLGLMFWLAGGLLQGQSVRASLEFQADSFQLGSHVEATLSIWHPAQVVVEFPSARDFHPFELVSSRPQPTQTTDSQSFDVVVYTLRSFSLAPRQALNLPYSWYSRQDTGSGRVRSDSLLLLRDIPVLTDSLQFRSSSVLLPLQDPPNYLRAMLVALGLGLAAVLIVVLLRRPLRKYWLLRNLGRGLDRARRGLDRLAQENNQEIQLESLNSLWRAYVDPKAEHQLGAMTTTELREGVRRLRYLDLADQQVLVQASVLRDRVLFAGETVARQEVGSLVDGLRRVLDKTYAHRKAAIQAGR